MANLFYNCGQTSEPIWLMEAFTDPQEEFPNWQIQYTFGTTWRIAIFNFIVDHTVKEPTVKFVSENPGLQYVSKLFSISHVIFFQHHMHSSEF